MRIVCRPLLLAAVAILARVSVPAAQVLARLPEPRPLPDFALPPVSASGPPVTPSTISGKIAIFEFWYPECVYCGEQHESLVRLAQRYGPDSVEIVAVNTRQSRETAQAFLAQHSTAPYHEVMDSTDFADKLGVNSAPLLAIVDCKGRIVYWAGGQDVTERFPSVLDELLAQRRSPTAPQ